jgi:hypothetical protein
MLRVDIYSVGGSSEYLTMINTVTPFGFWPGPLDRRFQYCVTVTAPKPLPCKLEVYFLWTRICATREVLAASAPTETLLEFGSQDVKWT